MDEFKIIENIKTQAEQLPQNLILSIGDDAALFQGSDNFTYMITTDTFNQFVHFDFIYQKPKDIGFKSVVASLSDIAA
ncbi:MAG: thiamine-phosphate kinase, partial [Candidatus Coatesbacteria bacterium]|nr:thiamine-phosphate kinase [Candidatus Coatesbacteria bacterium]